MKAVFNITGGGGRFEGALGSGIMTLVPGSAKGQFICTFDGTISAPW